MDTIDKKILEVLQEDIPLDPHPYRRIGDKLGLSEEDILCRIKRLKREGIIRHIRFLFDHKKLSFTSTLVAMKVPEKKLDEVARIVNAYPEITHNYARRDEFNLWFVLVAKDRGRIQSILQEISSKTGITNLLELPVERQFKLKVNITPQGGLSK